MRIGLIGLGKTGKEVARMIVEQDNMELVAVICSPASAKKGKDIGEFIGCKDTGIIIDSSENLEEIIFRTKPDVVVDFSNPNATIRNAKVFSKMKINIVIATTGFSDMALKKIIVMAKKYRNGIVYTPNITLGVNVLMLISNIAANILSGYDFQITEVHHKNKKDTPSGTAFKIFKEIKKGISLSDDHQKQLNIPIHAVRAGGIIGKHSVMIAGEEDKIEISHESFSRRAFALGAIKAITFIFNKTVSKTW